MHPLVGMLLQRRAGPATTDWHALWDELRANNLDRDDALILLACLAGGLPGHETLRTMLDSFTQRRRTVPATWPGTVNIVGTGGGPSTFNISTAAAFTAAATGTHVVKSGSRAYTSKLGSVDLLERLGIRLTTSYDRTAEQLDRHGIAFTGGFVYPPELTSLARLVLPLGLKPFGRFLNTLGPLLAAMPVAAQLTGVSDPAVLPMLDRLTAADPARRIWLCVNDLGSDELVPFTANTIYANDRDEPILLAPRGSGSMADLRPGDDPVEYFLQVMAGHADPAALSAVALNAAALAMAAGDQFDWDTAVSAADAALRDGSALNLVHEMRQALTRHG